MRTLERRREVVVSSTHENVTLTQLIIIEQGFHLLLTEIYRKNLQEFDQERFLIVLEALIPFKTSNNLAIIRTVKRIELICTMLLNASEPEIKQKKLSPEVSVLSLLS